MIPRDLFAMCSRIKAKTTNDDMVRICDALMLRLTAEMADAADVRPQSTVKAAPSVPRAALPKNKGKRSAANLR